MQGEIVNLEKKERENGRKGKERWDGCILGSLLVGGLILYCLVVRSGAQLQRLDLPSDSQLRTCSLDFSHSYPLLYIDLQSKQPIFRCVAHCPDQNSDNEVNDSDGNTVFSPYSQRPDFQMGGICLSEAKRAALTSRGLFQEILFKEGILGKMKSLMLIMALSGGIGAFLVLVFYFLPIGASFTLAVAAQVAVLGVFLWMAAKMEHYWQLYLGIGLFLLVMVGVGWAQGWGKLKAAAIHAQTSPSRLSLRLVLRLLLSSALITGILLLVLWEYLSLVSSELLTKTSQRVFFSADKQIWKYLLLGIQWMFLSQFVAAFHSYVLTNLGREIASNEQQQEFSISILLKIGQSAMIHTIFWIPLKLTLFFKPQGAILRQKDEEPGYCLALTRCSHCLCGAAINWLHAWNFNPFLVVSVDLSGSLRAVQMVYHRVDPAYDCSSVWFYRFSSCLSIGMGCILLGDNQFGSSYLFDAFAFLFALQIAYPWLSAWSILIQAQEFKDISRSY